MTIAHYGPSPNPLEDWHTLLESPPERIAIDTETVSINDITLLGVGLCSDGDNGFYISHEDPEFGDVVDIILQNPYTSKVYHNAPFDLRVLRAYEADITNIDDTLLMARLLPEPVATLEDLAFWVGRQTNSMRTLMDAFRVSKASELPFEVLAEKCCRDSIVTRALYDYYASNIDMDYYHWLRPMISIFNRISRQGLKLDQDRLQELNKYYLQKVSLYRQLCTAQGVNPASPQQVGYYLASRGNFLPLSKKGSQLVTDDEHLIKLKDPMSHVILNFRHHSKMESTYIRPFLGLARAYTTLRMDGRTGRANSTKAGQDQPDRNLQNIPKQAERGDAPSIRGAFIPDNGVFTKLDQSQGELRVLAELSQDQAMIDIFLANEDIHGYVQQRTGLTRTLAKNLNFGLMYGGDVQTIADFLHWTNLSLVEELLARHRTMFPRAWEWLEDQEKLGLSQGYVTTRRGRKMLLPVEQGEKHMRNCARNYPIQGTAFECMVDLMTEPTIIEHLDITRLQVHDELIMDGVVVVEDMKLNPTETSKEGHPVYDVRERMAWLSGFYLPLQVQYVERWG